MNKNAHMLLLSNRNTKNADAHNLVLSAANKFLCSLSRMAETEVE